MKDNIETVHRYHTFVLLMLSGGFMGAFSYYYKGGVFANAETANMLILSKHIVDQNISGVLHVLAPIITFIIGTIISQHFIEKIKDKWSIFLISFAITMLLLLSLLPESTPFVVFHVTIALISSMEFNTFREARGVAMSTLFCTAHLRGMSASLYTAVADKDKKAAKRFGYHLGLLSTFIVGAVLCELIGRRLGGYTIALAAIPLLFVLVEVVRNSR